MKGNERKVNEMKVNEMKVKEMNFYHQYTNLLFIPSNEDYFKTKNIPLF